MKGNSLARNSNLIHSHALPAPGYSSRPHAMGGSTSCSGGWVQGASPEMILLQINDGIVVCNAHGLIVLANAGAKQLARQDPEGRALDCAQDIWGELFDAQGFHIPLEEWPPMKALHGETTSQKQCRIVRPEGGVSDILFGASPVPDAAGELSG